jgi:DNA helicase-2/ATP-dependent DNA helicase PcrA
VQWFINNAKEAGLRAAYVQVDDPFSHRMLECYQAYEQQCNKEGVVDFPNCYYAVMNY